MPTKRFVVIGGGITGLAAAHRLVERAESKRTATDITLLEASDRVGGVIHTIRQDGFLIEAGPDNFITTKPWALALAKRLGINDQLIETNHTHRRAMVVHRGRLRPVPDGFQMTAPTRYWPVMTSPLLSLTGKIRLTMEPLVPARSSDGDESLTCFVTRRFGRQLLDRLVQPLVSGIYTADPDCLSVHATLPEFREMEARYGSIWRGMRALAKTHSTDAGARYSLFVTFRNGMQTLPDALEDRIGSKRLLLNHPVASVRRGASGEPSWIVTLNDGTDLDADGVVIAVPTHHAATILTRLDPTLANELACINYASSAVVNLAYKRKDIAHPMNAFGFVVPTIEKRKILAGSFSSVKYAHRAPNDSVLLRVFLGGATQPQLLELDDRQLTDIAQKELGSLLGIQHTPQLAMVHRWSKSMPQYAVGHLDRVQTIRQRTQPLDGLELAGNAYDGVGIPDCIHSGEQAAERLFLASHDR